jgi:hypothetical protein
MTRG